MMYSDAQALKGKRKGNLFLDTSTVFIRYVKVQKKRNGVTLQPVHEGGLFEGTHRFYSKYNESLAVCQQAFRGYSAGCGFDHANEKNRSAL